MRKIKYIAVHCTAGSQKNSVGDVMRAFQARGWKYPGYHYVIAANGEVTQLLDEDKISNGVKGFNAVTVNVAYIGGIDSRGGRVLIIGLLSRRGSFVNCWEYLNRNIRMLWFKAIEISARM